MPRRPVQTELFGKIPLEHGGKKSEGKRKTYRPIDLRRPVHVTLRARDARGARSLLSSAHRKRVMEIVRQAGRRHGVRVMGFSNVGSHLHLLVRSKSRRGFSGFLRQASGHVAQAVTGAVKGRPAEAPGEPVRKYWRELAHSRVVSWGRDLRGVYAYLLKNIAEALGLPDPRGRNGDACLVMPHGHGPPPEEVYFLSSA